MTIFYRDIISQIGLYLSLSDLFNTSLTCKKFHSALCNNKTFWKSRYLQDFGSKKEKDIDWKKKYHKEFRCNVWIFGGQLGLNPVINFTPKRIPNLKAKYVACGAHHFSIIDHKNRVRVFEYPFDEISIISKIKAKYIACGDTTTVVIDQKNNVLIVQNNIAYLPSHTYTSHTKILKIPNLKAKSVDCNGDNIKVIDLENKVWKIEDGYINIFSGLIKTNIYFVVEYNIFDEDQNILTIPPLDDSIYRINARSNYPNSPYKIPCLIVTENREFSLYFGHDTTDNSKHISVACRYRETLVINQKNDMWRYPDAELSNADRCVTPPIQIHDIKAKSIACGSAHTMIVDHKGNIFAYGNNDYGQLGLEDYDRPYSDFSEMAKIPGFKAEMVACADYYTVIIGHKVKNDNLILHSNKCLPFPPFTH